jgi:uncharacterized SAM-binding protein YcdF (DUF218 family)
VTGGPRIRRALGWVRNSLAVLGGLQLAVVFTPATKWWLDALTGPWGTPEGDVLVVLGGDQVETGAAGRATNWRCFHAAQLWRRGHFERVLVSGAGDPPVAEQMKMLLVAAGVPEQAIATETRSHTTRENAVEVAQLSRARPERIALVSSDYHMRRATGAFKRAGVAVTPCPAPDGIKQYLRLASRWSLALELGLETGKLLYYRMRGWA